MGIGIVCEFNPFHNGHRHLLSEAKRLGGGEIICAMSGNFVQRGEIAAYDKMRRAELAVRNGADMVLENPFPFCCATAERFAASAVHILASSGLCDTLAFGCELGDESLYRETAEFLTDESAEKKLRDLVSERKNESYIRLREQLVHGTLGEKHAALLQNPNAALGLEYACAVVRQHAPLSLLPIPRIGAAHDVDDTPIGSICSASYLRRRHDPDTFARFCPSGTYELLREPRRFSDEKLYAALRTKLLFSPCGHFFDVPHDYRDKMIRAAAKYDRFDDFFDSLRAKHITDSRLRHMILFTLFSVTKEELSFLPDAALLLGTSRDGRDLLKKTHGETNDFFILPTLSHSKNAPVRDRERLKKQTLVERAAETLIR